MAFLLHAQGEFSLEAAAGFAVGFPGTRAVTEDGHLRFAWAVDDDWRSVSVDLHQTPTGVRGTLDPETDASLVASARRDVERILSLDVDGRAFAALGEHDAVVAGLQQRHGALRPVLFFTPYEAAAWTIIGQRIRMTQAATVMRRLADEHGERGAFPSPRRLAVLEGPQAGLTTRKVDWLRALAGAALDGRLGRDRLRGMDPDDAIAELQGLAGIGPFSAELILIRGAGAPDVLPRHEPRLARAARAAFGLSDNTDISAVAEAWRPYRSWVSLLLRLDSDG